MARVSGLLYLYVIIAGIVGEAFVKGKLIIPGDATATADNILASQLLWRVSLSSQIIMLFCTVILALIFFKLLSPVSKLLSLLALLFNLVSIAIEAFAKLNLFAVLFLLDGSHYLDTFEPTQLRTLAYLSIRLHSAGYNIALAFFGVNCVLWGYLIYKSAYFSKIVGVLLAIAGICYLTNSFSWFLNPTFAEKIFPTVLLPCLVGELSLSLWLLLKPFSSEQKIS